MRNPEAFRKKIVEVCGLSVESEGVEVNLIPVQKVRTMRDTLLVSKEILTSICQRVPQMSWISTKTY